ncbi:MAG: hypothetical protein NZL85_04765 [Fimbriimonadales bacterium]|nr:hypothetical protein [Fimbriimonadales bacterium]
MQLTQVWQEALPADTLSFDVLELSQRGTDPTSKPQLVTLDEQRLHFWLWVSGKFHEVRTERCFLQRDLYCLSNPPGGKPLIYTDGRGFEWGEKSLTAIIPTRKVPIGRLVDEEGLTRILCFDHDEESPVYYIPDKPDAIDDTVLFTPDDLFGGKLQSVVMSVPRLAKAYSAFYGMGYRFLCLLRSDKKQPVRVYGVAPDRIAWLELRNGRPYARWRTRLEPIGAPRKESPLVVRMGDPKGEGTLALLIMQATRSRAQLRAFRTR